MAVLEKVKPLPWERESSEIDKTTENLDTTGGKLNLGEEAENNTEKGQNKRPLDEESKRPANRRRKRKKLIAGYREDPFVFFKDDKEDVWLSIK